MAWRGQRFLDHPGPRHQPEWYDQTGEASVLEPGDRMIIRCEGGPCSSRLEIFPPRLELEERDGMYVLCDEGRRDDWCYVFVPSE